MSSNLFATYLTSAGGSMAAAEGPGATVFTSAGGGGVTPFFGLATTSAVQPGSSPLMVASPLLAAAAGNGGSSVTSSSGSFPSSLSASSTPIFIGGAGALAAQKTAPATASAADALRVISSGGGSVGTDGEMTTAAGSAASSFSANLGNLYMGSLPEGLLLPFLCQQQLQHQQQQLQIQQQQQQQLQQQQLISSLSKSNSSTFGGLSAQTIATTVQSLLIGSGVSTTASISATPTPAASASTDIELSTEERNAEQLTNQMKFVFRNHLATNGGERGPAHGTSLPSMSLFLNNFISNNVQKNNLSNSNNNVQMDTGLAESVIESPKLDQTSLFHYRGESSTVSDTVDICGADYSTTSTRTTSECSTAGEDVATSVAAATVTGSTANTVAAAFAAATAVSRKSSAMLMIGGGGAMPAAIEQLRNDALTGQRPAGERSSSPLKMRSRLNSRNKGVVRAGERSTTPPGGQLAEDDQSNICNVCGDEASGRHYGAATCFGCKGFFRRTVRANKTYSCRYEERCAIDKLGRNTCRSCRFRKCLNVGMEPDAIRPDRDKTGRQKNPRRQSIALPTNQMPGDAAAAIRAAASSLPSSHDSVLAQQLTDDEMTPTGGPSALPRFPFGASGRGQNDDAAMAEERDLIIDTLRQIERICANFQVDDIYPTPVGPPDVCGCAEAVNNDIDTALFHAELSEVIARPSPLFNRPLLDYTGRRGSVQQSGSECWARRHFQRAFRRLVVLSVDFANTLKPIADFDVRQKENLIRSCIAPYMVFLTAYHTVAAGRSNCVLLSDGRFVDAQTPFSAYVDPRRIGSDMADTIFSKIRFIQKWIIDSVQNKMEKMKMTEIEFVCLKAIIMLDPAAPAVDASVTQMLSIARESVQSALFLHLADRHSTNQAIYRYGQLLMMIANVSKIGAFIHNVMEMIASVYGDSDSATLRMFTGLDRMSSGYSVLVGGHHKDEKMSDDSEDDDEDEMDDMDANE